MKKFFAILLVLLFTSSVVFAAGPSDDSLISAAQKGDKKRVQAIMKLGTRFDGVLVHAIRDKKVDNATIKILIDAGVNVNGRDTWLVTGDTALMYCKNVETAKLLVNAGANVNLKNKEGFTALMRVGNSEVIEFLILSGADVNAMTNNYITPLMWQVKQNNFDAVRILLRYGADLLQQDRWGKTAYDYAQSPNMKDFLIDALSASDEEENEGDAEDEAELELIELKKQFVEREKIPESVTSVGDIYVIKSYAEQFKAVDGNGAILFSEPYTHSKQIMNLSNGDKLTADAQWSNLVGDEWYDWYYVHFGDVKGWVQAKFIKDREPD